MIFEIPASTRSPYFTGVLPSPGFLTAFFNISSPLPSAASVSTTGTPRISDKAKGSILTPRLEVSSIELNAITRGISSSSKSAVKVSDCLSRFASIH